MTTITFQDIVNAHRIIQPFIHRTPVFTCQTINQFTGGTIYFKCENLQKVGAFKYRGATHSVQILSQVEASKGVATHSSGNHAAALSLAAQKRNISAYIVMPETAPKIKVAAVEGYGGKITFCKPTLEDREKTLEKIVRDVGAKVIHPFNYEPVIIGQATAALEFLEEVPELDIMMAPVGGGGLLSGTALTTHFVSPSTVVIAGEPQGADDAYRSLLSGKIESNQTTKTIADGLLTSLGSMTYPIIKQFVSEIVLADDDHIIKAMRLIFERMKLVVEPSAVVPLAAILQGNLNIKGKKVGIILSGGNVDVDRLPWL